MNYHLLLIANIIIVISAAWHALIFKRDPRASIGWIAVIFLFPVMGPILYFLLGINRVKTRAHKLSENASSGRFWFLGKDEEGSLAAVDCDVQEMYLGLAGLSGRITGNPLTGSNSIELFHNGENAYPAMHQAIDEAQDSIFLSTFIFDTDETGMKFIDKLSNAVKRGVDVRVIIDGIGEYYSWPRAGSILKKNGVNVVRFIPPSMLPPAVHINLRNHRKILVADGSVCFVGGMNIGGRHLADDAGNKSRVVDTHFRLKGPVISQILEAFIEDWNFITKKDFTPVIKPGKEDTSCNTALCRVITDGPNEDLDKLAIIIAGVISSAKKQITIMTPYFLPSRDIISALQIAALKGVKVNILLPAENNIPFVHWATRNMLWELLQRGVNVYYQPPPFVHSKLLAVDDYYAHIGTANMDARSLRLNFELVVEIFDEPFVRDISRHMEEAMKVSEKITLHDVDSRNYLARARDSLAWLFYPYL